MQKIFFHAVRYRLPFIKAAPAASLKSVVLSAADSSMHDYYHHGLCAQGRKALQIDPDSRRQLRWAKIIDAFVLAFWGAGLLSLMWLGTAAGF